MFGHVPQIGIISKDYYFSMFTDGSKKRLHRLSRDAHEKNLLNDEPERAKKLEDIATAFYETANYMRYNNQRKSALPGNKQ